MQPSAAFTAGVHPTSRTWLQFERRFAAGGYVGLPKPQHEPGSGVLVTAPHAVWHTRKGGPKPPDLNTGGLALAVAAGADTSALAQSGVEPHWSDWASRDDQFSRALVAALPQVDLIVDLHGMADRHGVDLCIGLGPAPGPAEQHAAEAFRAAFADAVVTTNKPFNATAPHTVTAFAQSQGVPALQLELSRTLRTPDHPSGRQTADRLISALQSIVVDLPRTGRS